MNFELALNDFKKLFREDDPDYPVLYEDVKYFSGLEKKEFDTLKNGLLNFQKKHYNKYIAGQCGNIHNLHMEDIGLLIPSSKALYLTFGVLYDNGKNVYNVPELEEFNRYRHQIFGINTGGKSTFNYHAWITLDSGEILDLAHYFTLSKIRKNKKLLNPIFGSASTIKNKYNFGYVPYYIAGHITQSSYGKENSVIFNGFI